MRCFHPGMTVWQWHRRGSNSRANILRDLKKNKRMDHLGFDPSTSSLRRTRASDCANNPCEPSTCTQEKNKIVNLQQKKKNHKVDFENQFFFFSMSALAGYKHLKVAFQGQSTVIFSKRRKISSIWTDPCGELINSFILFGFIRPQWKFCQWVHLRSAPRGCYLKSGDLYVTRRF